jgi:hypothetical protein
MSDYVRLTNFDFHAVVKGNQFDNLSSLIQMLRQSIKEYGGFLMNLRSREIVSLQQGVFRVNCLDCLDRYAIIYYSLRQYKRGARVDLQVDTGAILSSRIENDSRRALCRRPK